MGGLSLFVQSTVWVHEWKAKQLFFCHSFNPYDSPTTHPSSYLPIQHFVRIPLHNRYKESELAQLSDWHSSAAVEGEETETPGVEDLTGIPQVQLLFRFTRKNKEVRSPTHPPTHPPTPFPPRPAAYSNCLLLLYLSTHLFPYSSSFNPPTHPPTHVLQQLIQTAFFSSTHPPTHPPTHLQQEVTVVAERLKHLQEEIQRLKDTERELRGGGGGGKREEEEEERGGGRSSSLKKKSLIRSVEDEEDEEEEWDEEGWTGPWALSLWRWVVTPFVVVIRVGGRVGGLIWHRRAIFMFLGGTLFFHFRGDDLAV